MPTTDQQRRAIAYLVRTYRETVYGANAWDEPGILAALTKVRGIECGIVTVAAMRAAADPSLKTPAKLADTSSVLYAEQVGPPTARRHAKPETACRTCGRDFSDDPLCCDRPALRAEPSERVADHATQARELLRSAAPRPATEPRPHTPNPHAEAAREQLHAAMAGSEDA
jgi:hypothetical protein